MTVKLSEDHVYTVDGVVAPSVSEILGLYFPPSSFYTDEGRENGTTRHQWYEFLAQGLEPEHEPHSDILGAVEGFKKFLADVKPEYVSGEIPYYHPALKYCGKPDGVFKISGKLALVDYKPFNRNKRTRVQTAAYKTLLTTNNIPVVDRFELRLGNGMYRLEKHEDKEDEKRWHIMVAAFHASKFYK